MENKDDKFKIVMEGSEGRVEKVYIDMVLRKQILMKNHSSLEIISLVLQIAALLLFIFLSVHLQISTSLTDGINIIKWGLQYGLICPLFICLLNFMMVIAVVILLWTQTKSVQESWNELQSRFSPAKLKNVTSILYLMLELLAFPSQIIITNTIRQVSLKESPFIIVFCWLILFILFVVFVSQSDNLLGSHIIIILFSYLLASATMHSVVFLLYSLKYGIKERRVLRKVVYYECSWLVSQEIICLWDGMALTLSNFIMGAFLLLLFAVVSPQMKRIYTQIQKNDYVIRCIKLLEEEQSLAVKQKIVINKIVSQFEEKWHHSQNQMEQNQTISQFCSLKQQITPESLQKFLISKIKADITQNPRNIILKMQLIQCQLLSQTFNMSILYQIEKIGTNFTSNSSYPQRKRYNSLLFQIERQNQSAEESISSSTIISIEKMVEKFYDGLSMIITNYLQIWALLQKNRLTQTQIMVKLNKIIHLQGETKTIINELNKLRDMRMQKQVYNYLMSLTNFQKDPVFEKEIVLITNDNRINNTNFIYIVNNRVVDISNQIIRELHSNRTYIIGEKIQQLFTNQFKGYITKNIDSLLQKRKVSQETILPLKASNGFDLIVPFRCRFEILPGLTNGIQYLIHIINNLELRTSPTFLYSIESDKIMGVSPDFYSYFQMEQSTSRGSGSLGLELFGLDIASILNSQEESNNTYRCELKINKISKNTDKPINRRRQLSVVLRVIQQYQIKEDRLIYLQIQERDSDQFNKTKSLTNFLSYKGTLLSQNQKLTNLKKHAITTTFCRIPNPYETLIDEKLSQPSSCFRLSYLKIVWVLIVVILGVILTGLVMMTMQVSATGGELDTAIETNMRKNNCLQQIYLLFYQFYQYVHISTYPAHYTAIQPYNMTKETQEYRIKAESNIALLLDASIDSTIRQTKLTYQLQYDHFRDSQVTQTISMVSFLTDTKQALITNDPHFMVQNEYVISTIAASYLPISLETMANLVQLEFTLLTGILMCVILFVFLIKAVVMRIRMLIWDILLAYQKLPIDKLKQYQTNLKDLMSILKHSNLYKSRKNGREVQRSSEILRLTEQSSQNSIFSPSSRELSQNTEQFVVRKQSVFSLFAHNNIILVIPLILAIYFYSYLIQIRNYESEAKAIVTYSDSIQNSMTMIILRAQQFYQCSMEEILPIEERRGWKRQTIRNITTYFKQQLPSFFDQYIAVEKKMLRYDLCNYSYLNTGSLYVNINCSLLLNGVMKTGFSQTYAAYMDLVQDFINLEMKNLGSQFREGGTYPVFMQVAYIRRTVYNVLVALQNEFNKTTSAYIDHENAYLLSFIRFGYCLLPLIVLIAISFTFQVKTLCIHTIKAFKILPRSFLLNISTAKLLQSKNVLDRIEWLIF